MTKYHVLFTKGAIVKATSARSSCIARIRIMNEIQRAGFIGAMLRCYLYLSGTLEIAG